MRTLRPKTYVGWIIVPALSILLALLVASVLIIASGLIGPEKKIDLLLPLVAYRSLLQRGVHFRDEPHVVHRAGPKELWMSFFDDGEGNVFAIRCWRSA